MPIFRLENVEENDMSKGELVIAQETNLELERHLENWLENSPLALAQDTILWIGRQTSAKDEDGTIFSDLLGVDFQGNLVIAELKKGRTPRDIIAQLLDYAAWADRLTESQIREIAEAYFKTRGVFQGKTFNDAFKEVFEIPETDELPPLNRGLRLFIVAEEIPSRVARVCRFLRTSHGMDVSCIDVSTFETESGEVLVSTETTVGDEGFAAPKAQQQHTAPPTRWSGDKPLDLEILETVEELMQADKESFTLKEVRGLISEKYSDFIPSRVDYQVYSDCVNFPTRRDYPQGSDRYWRISRGKFRLYDPKKDEMEGDTENNSVEHGTENSP